MKNIHCKVMLDTRRGLKKKNGLFPLRLRITYSGQRKYLSMNSAMSEVDYSKIISSKKGRNYSILNEWKAEEANVLKCAKELKVFSFEALISKLDSSAEHLNGSKLYDALLLIRDEKLERFEESTAQMFEDSAERIKRFRPGTKISAITPTWLKVLENELLAPYAITTISITMRHIRQAVLRSDVPKELYPFGKKKYRIPERKNTKRALTTNQLKMLRNYKPKTAAERKAFDFWWFSFYCNGANITDIAHFKKEDLEGTTWTFYRKKTEHSVAEPIVIELGKEALNIVRRYLVKGKYIFGIGQRRSVIKQFTKRVNFYMKRIGEELEIDLKITTYVARHSYATLLLREGYSAEQIREGLGHQSVKTTMAYLDSLGKESRIKIKDLLETI